MWSPQRLAGTPLPRASRGNIALRCPEFGFWLQDLGGVSFCCFKSPGVWGSGTMAPGRSAGLKVLS